MKTSRTIAALTILLLAAACASSGDDRKSTLLTEGEHESTSDFDVRVVQTNEPVLVGDQGAIDVRFRISVRNQTAMPVTLRRIHLSSIGSAPLEMGGTLRQFDKVITPGESETFDFWSRALVNDFTRAQRLPVTLRLRTVFRGDSGKDRTETFMRRVAAEYTWVGR